MPPGGESALHEKIDTTLQITVVLYLLNSPPENESPKLYSV